MKLIRSEMAFDRGYCRPGMCEMFEVCRRGDQTDYERHKSAIQIGHAVWVKDLCIVNTGHGMS